MSIETVRVTPGMLPPTMSTTPNSPMVWAKLRTTPVTTPAIDNGNVTRTNVASRDIPRVHEASTNYGFTCTKAYEQVWTACDMRCRSHAQWNTCRGQER